MIEKQKLTREEYMKQKKGERRKNNKDKKKIQKTVVDLNQQIRNEVPQIDLEVEDQPETAEVDELITGKDYEFFKGVFDQFKSHGERLMIKTYERYDPEKEKQQEELEQEQIQEEDPAKPKEKKEVKLSKKQRKQQRWLKVAELKQRVRRPDLVEFWDITSPDPLFLIHMKSVRNTVSIPRHWSQKRKYLQNKRGILKDAFQLPDYIEKTGIAKLRDPFVERDGGKMVRQKLRERMNPKQGKLDIDYQVLHDAFFKHQTKSFQTKHGEIYYEGKEEEIRAKNFCPGKMSAELRGAMGCGDYQAPPWLPNMQRYGPPPSYPHMRFIGMASIFAEPSTYHQSVKQVIEDSCKKADQPGVYAIFKYMDDEDINELQAMAGIKEEGVIDKELWGKIEEVEEEMEVEDNEEEEQQQPREPRAPPPPEPEQRHNIKSVSQIISGLQTPEVDLRKNLQTGDMKPLFTVLEQVQNQQNKGIFGTGHSYVVPSQQQQ